jgi:UDP-glucose 4-epimerase
MEFYKNKLKEKVDLIFKNKGLENNLVLKDSLFIGIKPGKYEIVWDIKQENILKLEPINGEVNIESGVYHVNTGSNNFGNHWKTLYSYQYIEFSLKEERDKKIKEVFKTMKTILVTGGAGYIGTHTIVELLKDPNYDVILLDNFSNSNLLILNQLKKVTNKPIKVYDFDCRSNLDDIFSDNKIDGVIHFAAFKSVGESVENPLLYYDNNINSLINLLNTCQRFGVNNFVFSSSCSLYGNVLPGDLPVNEETPLSDPESPYAYTKLVGERILQDFSNSNPDFKIISLRYFNPVGAHESGLIGELPINKPNNILLVICNSADTGEEMTIFGTDYDTPDGSCIRDYIHVSDIANAHYLALEYVFQTMENSYDVFNLGSEKGYSVIELISAFEEENEVKVNAVFGNRREGDVVKIYSNSFKARKLLNWKAEKTIDDIVKSAWNWHKNKI